MTSQPAPPTRAAHRRRVPPRALAASLAVLSVVALALGASLGVDRAWASYERITETGHPGMLQLSRSTETPLWTTLEAGQRTRWLIRAELVDAAAGSLALELRADGELVTAGGLEAAIEACDGEFALSGDAASCSGSAEPVRAMSPLRAGAAPSGSALPAAGRGVDRYRLAELRRGEPRDLLVTLQLPEREGSGAAAAHARTARVGLGLFAAGDGEADGARASEAVEVRGPAGPARLARLAVTGADLLPLALLALGLIGLGACAALRRRGDRFAQVRGGAR